MRPTLTVAVLIIGGALLSDQIMVAHAQMSAPQVAALKQQYRRAPARPIENQAVVALGRELFFDTALSASGKTACVSCHLPNLAWAVTDARSINDSGKPTSRKSPTLIGIGHAGSPADGWDGRNRDAGGAGQGLGRDRLDVDARNADAGGGRSDRGAFPRESGLCGEIQGGAAGRADQSRHHRAGDRRLRADDRARTGAVRPLGRGR